MGPRWGLACLLVMLGCDDHADGGDGPGSDPTALIGSWREVPPEDGTPLERREVYTFVADGTYHQQDFDGYVLRELDGTYDVDEHDLRFKFLEYGDAAWRRKPYLIRGDRMLLEAMYPTEPSADPVGTWTSDFAYGNEAFDESTAIVMKLRLDYTAHYTEHPGFDGEGDWNELDGTIYVNTYNQDASVVVPLQLLGLDGLAMGRMFERL